MPSTEADLRVPGLAELSSRRSDKWAGQPPGVVAATIAEMDFPIARPVAEALHAAVERHDLGYAPASPDGLFAAFAGFAERRLAGPSTRSRCRSCRTSWWA